MDGIEINELSLFDILDMSKSRDRHPVEMTMEEIEIKFKEEELEGHRQDREQRKDFANKIFKMMAYFLAASFIIVLLSAIRCICFKLSDTVLITLLTTTTANIIGVFVFVARYLFKADICQKCGVKISSKSKITTNS